jgi:hypothetical protein
MSDEKFIQPNIKNCYCVKCNIKENRKVTLESMALWSCHLMEKQLEKHSIENAKAKLQIELLTEKFIDMQRVYVKEVRSGKQS